MLNTKLIKSYTDLRLDPAGVTNLAASHGPVYIFHRNNPKSVVLDVADFEQMVEELLDSRDSAWLKQNEERFKNTRGIASADLRRKYKLTK